MAGQGQPVACYQRFGQDIADFGRGTPSFLKENALTIICLAVLTGISIGLRPWVQGKKMLTYAAIGLGGGFVLSTIPVIGGGSTSYVEKADAKMHQMGSCERMLVWLVAMAAFGVAMQYIPEIAVGVGAGIFGNWWFHRAKNLHRQQQAAAQAALAAANNAPQNPGGGPNGLGAGNNRFPGQGYRLGGPGMRQLPAAAQA